MKNERKRRGFTLVELLATILILSIIFGVVIYVAINVINTSRENSYKVAINNIEEVANDYLIENSNKLFYVSDVDNSEIEYQCVTVKDLIETGYFKNDVLESKVSNDKNVQLNDYVYLERNINTKVITKTKYLIDGDLSLCNDNVVNATGDVVIAVAPTGWSKYKEITLRYRVKNYYNEDDYTFEYSYDNSGVLSVVSDEGSSKRLKVTDNGKIRGYIKDKSGKIIAESVKNISDIDITPPVITINTNASSSYVQDISSKITVSDTGSGGDTTTYKYIYSTNNTATPNTKFNSGSSYTLSDKNGVYYLIVEACDKLGNCTTKVSDKLYTDNTNPVITIGTNRNSSYAKSVSSKITVSDTHSGGDTTTYKYIYSTSSSATPNTAFSSGSSYTLSGKTGDYYLVVKACDKAGNCASKVSNKFYVDNTGPTITIGTNGNSSYAKSVSSKITVSDTHSGGNTSTYKYIYSTSSSTTPSTTFSSGSSYTLSGQTGTYYLVVKACDKASNCTTKTSNKFYLDNTSPVITISGNLTKIYGSQFNLYEGVTVTDNVSTNITKKVYLGSSEITSYSQLPYGTNVLTYKATDSAGNVASKTRTITLVVADKQFDYLENDQTYNVEANGTYIIEAYGAQGGNSGGKGGYVKAEVTLKKGDKLIINTGGVNGYNGGGGYKNSSYISGGGATTVRYNSSYIVVAAGGGAKGSAGTAGVGGSGNGAGGASPYSGASAGLSGSNGGGGSNSLNYKYDCECETCGGECQKTENVCYDTCHGKIWIGSSCPPPPLQCENYYEYVDYPCSCYDECTSYSETYPCNCEKCTASGLSGKGGSNKVVSPAVIKTNTSGSRSGNGYAKVSYKLGG